MADLSEVDLESQEFREALLSRLNGQTEDVQRLIKVIDTRFQSHARRMREHGQQHREEQARFQRLVLASIGTAPTLAVALLKIWESIV